MFKRSQRVALIVAAGLIGASLMAQASTGQQVEKKGVCDEPAGAIVREKENGAGWSGSHEVLDGIIHARSTSCKAWGT